MTIEKILQYTGALAARASAALDYARGNSNIVTAYLSTLFYLEIMYIMALALFTLGLLPALSAGLVLTGLYTAHLVRLYFRRNIHRIIQLAVMEVHCAYTIGFLYNALTQGPGGSTLAVATIAVRAVMLAVEVPLIVLLTGERVIDQYD